MASAYSDVAQGRKDFKLQDVFGDDFVSSLSKFKFATNSSLKTYCTHPALTLSPANGQPDADLVKWQKMGAEQFAKSQKLLALLKDGTKRTFTTQKDAYLYGQKATTALGEAVQAPEGWMGALAESTLRIAALTPKGNDTYKNSTIGKAVAAVFAGVGTVWASDQETLNTLDSAVRRAKL